MELSELIGLLGMIGIGVLGFLLLALLAVIIVIAWTSKQNKAQTVVSMFKKVNATVNNEKAPKKNNRTNNHMQPRGDDL